MSDYETSAVRAATETMEAETVKADMGPVFVQLGFVEECDRDIAKALTQLADRLQPILSPRNPSPSDGGGNKDDERVMAPMVDRLCALNRSQNITLLAVMDLIERLAI